ncbi:MAG: hypothetical protein GEU81_11735 [Nitriliruptorales bacterium]|nr:hypothetical protein [Nitriliruptorales bacterium]
MRLAFHAWSTVRATSVLAVLALLAAACGGGGGAGDGGADGEEGQSISLTVGAGHEAGGAITYANWLQDFFVPELESRVEEETPHTISINEAYGGTIAGTDEVWEAIGTGLLDIGGFCYCFEPSDLFLHALDFYVPFSSPDPQLAQEAFREVFDNNPYMTEVIEENNQMLLALYGTSSYELITQFPVETLEDLDGRAISAAGPNLPWIPEDAVNVQRIQGALPEWYTGLQTGVFNGAIMFPESSVGFRLYEVAEHYTLVGFGASPQGGIHINTDTWESLPEDVQQIVLEVGQEYEATIPDQIVEEREQALQVMEEAGTTINELDEEARLDWVNALPEYPLQQIEEAESRGIEDARAIVQTYIEAQEARGYEFPRDWQLE